MFLATSNPPEQLLYLRYIGQVKAEELVQAPETTLLLLADLKPGFRILSDLGQVDAFAGGCEEEIGYMMQVFNQKGLALVVRVVPEANKDFGFNIMSLFHYPRSLRVVTCDNMTEALKVLSL